MKTKLSDYVAQFLAKQGIRHVFAITGGASLHLIHSLADTPGIDFICPQHEQAAAMAADAYSRVSNNLGAAMATSGPGATNLITGICCAYYDSVPVIYVTGQVATFRFKGDTGVRQIGFQETEVVEMCAPITKYAVKVTDPKRIRYELEKACHIACSNRPGPVLVDIPDNLQRAQIDPEQLESYIREDVASLEETSESELQEVIRLVTSAKRPVLVLGWGIRLAGAEEVAKALIDKLGFPVLPTWGLMDLLPASHPLLVGTFGTHGTRYGNFAIQNSDLVFSIGSRLDTKATGGLDAFAREAKIIIVDIDSCELAKFEKLGKKPSLTINAEAKTFINQLTEKLNDIDKTELSTWLTTISNWKQRYPVCKPEYLEEQSLNPYVFVKTLSQELPNGALMVADTGCCIAWLAQGFEFKENQRLIHDFNNTAMGYALPAAIGACFATNRQPIICLSGDGSLLMNLQELATVQRHNLPIKIFLMNNHGHSMIQQTQDQWLNSQYIASSVEGGLASPDFVEIAKVFGFKTFSISENHGLQEQIEKILSTDGLVFCNLEISSAHRVIPQVRYGRTLEDPEPFLERDEFFSNMLVKPHPSSFERSSKPQLIR